MDKIKDSFKKLSSREKTLIYILVILLIVCFGWLILLQPQLTSHTSLKSSKDSLELQLTELKVTSSSSSTEDIKTQIMNINKEIKDAIFNHQHINNEIFDILEKENIYIKDLTCGYYLKTTRHDIILPDGVLSLDENEYNHHHDYEIEFEVEDYDQGLQTFKKIIQPYHLEYKQNCLSKIKRMLETLKNE